MRRFKKNLWWLIMVLVAVLYGCKKDEVKPINDGPIAHAGNDQQAEIGSIVKLDASGSTDPEGDELTYNWSIISKPATSTSVIIGIGNKQAELTLDKAGSYIIQLVVSDGIKEAIDSLSITNRMPIINDINTDTETRGRFDDDFARKGGGIFIEGNYFSEDINENKVSLGGVSCEINFIRISDFQSDAINVIVPDNAVGGDLVITVGSQSVTWTIPLGLVNSPVADFVVDNTQLEEQLRSSYGIGFFEIGSRFKPLVNGKVVGFSLNLPQTGNFKVTLWDATNKIPLITTEVIKPSKNVDYFKLPLPVQLESGKEYMVTFNAENWYLYIDPLDFFGPVFPQTYNNIQFLSTAFHSGEDTVFPDEGTPNHYITKGADIIFVQDF